MARVQYLSPDDVVTMLGHVISKKTLSNWRSNPRNPGPAFTRIGGRILYLITDVAKWAAERRYTCTTEYPIKDSVVDLPGTSLADLQSDFEAKMADIQSKRAELDGLEGELLWLFERQKKQLTRRAGR
jgi:hypothetical protein